MGALAEVAGLLKVTLNGMMHPGATPTMVATVNPCPNLVRGKLGEGCTDSGNAQSYHRKDNNISPW